jgi:WD40 repeat protein
LAVLSGQGRNLLRVAWSPDGRTIATGGSGPSVWLWEPDGRFRYAWNDFGTGVSGDSSAAVSLLKFSPDSLSLLAGWGSRVRQVAAAVLLDMTDGHVRYRLPNVPNTPMCGLFLPAGDQFAVGFASGDIWFCAANDGHIIRNLRTQANGHFAAAWSPDGRAIAWGDINGSGSSIQGTRPLERAFCLETLDFVPPPDATFQRSIGDWGDWSIQRIQNSVVQVDWRGSPVSTTACVAAACCLTAGRWLVRSTESTCSKPPRDGRSTSCPATPTRSGAWLLRLTAATCSPAVET